MGRLGSSSYHLKDKGGSDDEGYDYYEDAPPSPPRERVRAGTEGIRRFLVLVDGSELLDTWGCGCGSDSVGETQANRGT